MMGSSHALSGAVVWLGLCAAAEPATGLQPDAVTVVAGAAVAAGAALWPDIDHPSSTVARSLGPATRIAGRIISYVSDKVRDHSCGCCATAGTHGHRTLTHTAVFALVMAVAVSAAGWQWEQRAGAIVLGAATALAAMGLLPRRRNWRSMHGRRITGLLVGVGVGAAVWHLGADAGWWWLGIPIGLGTLVHTAGDGLTSHGIPMWWPIRIRGCRWQRVGTPRWLRFRTGGPIEQLLVVVMLAGGLAAVTTLVWDTPAVALLVDAATQAASR